MVVIARFSYPHEAHIAKASLDSAGIHSFIADEHTINTQWLYSDAMGGVRLMVAKEDEAQALAILSTDFSQALQEEGMVEDTTSICPQCGGTEFEPYTKGKRPAFLAWLILQFPLFVFKHGYKCKQCGYFEKID